MRQFPQRPALPRDITRKLSQETKLIVNAVDKKAEAARRYSNARQSKWFKPALKALRRLSGPGERCMFCSGSESSDVEHYRPKAIFPELALGWENLLWSCGICNGAKSNQFPTGADQVLINPLGENVWDFFFIDEFGQLTARWSIQHNDQHPRAISTMQIIKLDRQALQEARQQRLLDLQERVKDSISLFESGKISKVELKSRVGRWLKNAFQPDVADYFLNGPGREDEPFASLFTLLKRKRGYSP